MKFAGVVIEPVWIWHDSGTGGGGGPASAGGAPAIAQARPANQSRHTVGGRITTKRTFSKVRVDVTGEGYYQFGEIGAGTQGFQGVGAAAAAAARTLDIDAYAFHIDGGVTLPVPM